MGYVKSLCRGPFLRLRLGLAWPVRFVCAGAANSSAPAKPSGLGFERSETHAVPKRARASGHFERPSGAEPARAANPSAPTHSSAPAIPKRAREPYPSAPATATPSGLEVGNLCRCGVCKQPSRSIKPRMGPSLLGPLQRFAKKNITSYLQNRARLHGPRGPPSTMLVFDIPEPPGARSGY